MKSVSKEAWQRKGPEIAQRLSPKVLTYAFRSAPAQKARPSPVTITTLDVMAHHDADEWRQDEVDGLCLPETWFIIEPAQDRSEVAGQLRGDGVEALRAIQGQKHNMLLRE